MEILYKGKLSSPMKLVANVNCLLAWMAGNAKDDKFKLKVKKAYNSELSDHLADYDKIAIHHYVKITQELLGEIDIKGKSVLDVGCGTGIASFAALDAGASKVIGVDASPYMLNKGKEKLTTTNNGKNIEFRLCNAEALDFPDESFDIVISSMIMGIVDPEKVISEMTRVLRKGGTLAFSAHGFEHNWEYAEMCAKTILFKPSFWGTNLFERIPYCARSEKTYERILMQTRLEDIKTKRHVWVDDFESPEDALMFEITTTGALIHALWKTPLKREKFLEAMRRSYLRYGMNKITQDVVYAYATK